MALLSNQFNNSSREQQVDPGNVVNFRYFDIDQIQSIKFPQKEKSLSFFHTNTCSLNKYLYAYLLKCTNKNFDIIAISETRTLKITSLTSNFRLKIYFFESAPTELTAGGTMLYLSNRIAIPTTNWS